MRYIVRIKINGKWKELWTELGGLFELCHVLYHGGVIFELYDTQKHCVILPKDVKKGD